MLALESLCAKTRETKCNNQSVIKRSLYTLSAQGSNIYKRGAHQIKPNHLSIFLYPFLTVMFKLWTTHMKDSIIFFLFLSATANLMIYFMSFIAQSYENESSYNCKVPRALSIFWLCAHAQNNWRRGSRKTMNIPNDLLLYPRSLVFSCFVHGHWTRISKVSCSCNRCYRLYRLLLLERFHRTSC